MNGRHGLHAALDALETGEATVLVVAKLDRCPARSSTSPALSSAAEKTVGHRRARPRRGPDGRLRSRRHAVCATPGRLLTAEPLVAPRARSTASAASAPVRPLFSPLVRHRAPLLASGRADVKSSFPRVPAKEDCECLF